MEKAKEIIEERKAHSVNRKPRYGFRKFSFGLASCMLGFIMYGSPSMVQAAETVLDETAVQNVEKQNEDKAIIDDVNNDVEGAEDELEISTEEGFQALKETNGSSEATEGSEHNGVISNAEITIGGTDNGEKTTTVNPTANDDRTDSENTDLNLITRIDFDIPEGTKAGSTFDVLISDNVNFNGIVKDEDVPSVFYNGDEIATGEKLTGEKRGYKYTFIDAVNNLADIRVRLEYPLFIDPKKVPNDSKKETVKVTLAGEDGTVIREKAKDYKVEYVE